jgi:hypothetical protein
MKNAKKKFRVGERVRMTEQALDSGVPSVSMGWPVFGEVVRFTRSSELVVVRVDGRKTAGTYHMDFWRKAPTEQATEGAASKATAQP